MKRMLLPLLALLSLQYSYAQTGMFTGKPAPEKSLQALNASLLSFDIYEVSSKDLSSFLKSDGYPGVIRMKLGEEYDWVISLVPNDFRSPDYRLRVGNEKGIATFADRPLLTYSGILTGSKGGPVRLTVKEGFLYGYVTAGKEEYYIEPVRRFDKFAQPDEYLVYARSAVIEKENLACGADETALPDEIKGDNLQSSSTEKVIVCKDVELAVASDHLMYQKYGSSVDDLEAYIFGVMNNVTADFTGVFNDNLQFLFREVFISTIAATDPVPTSTLSASTVLCDFKNWAEGGGFSISPDLGQFWTDRDFTGSTIGIAVVGGVCLIGNLSGCPNTNNLGYHALQDFSSVSACETRVLTSHEIGHNLGALHDASGSGFIMAPSVSCTNTWSAASITAVNGILPRTCLQTCGNVYGAPDARFTVNANIACKNIPVDFTDLSTNGPTSHSWIFTGGTPATSSAANPPVSYATNGTYNVSLTATNSMGNDTHTENNFIDVYNQPATTTSPNDNSSGTYGIQAVSLNGMYHFSSTTAVEGSYEDFACSSAVALSPGTTYDLNAFVGDCASSSFEAVSVYIDYNNNGSFLDAGEAAASSWNTGYCGELATPLSITTSSSPTANTILRMRVISHTTAITNPDTYDPPSGQVEDYGVLFAAALPVELVDFKARARDKGAFIDWKTAMELNNDYFDLQRSYDGKLFTAIGTVPGAGTSQSEHQYSYFDQRPYPGTNYYRLRQVDYDGAETFSPLVSVTIREIENNFELAPNPAPAGVNLLAYVDEPGPVRIETYNLAGRLITAVELDIGKGENKLELSLEGVAGGIYLVRIIYGGMIETKRLVVGE